MNWLAHLLLSPCEIEFQLGNLLADPLKGRLWERASQSLRDGVMMHQAIDHFTDSHPIVSCSKQMLGNKGHLRGVVLDVLYDHFLSLHWEQFAAIPLEEFLSSFNDHALKKAATYPEQPRRFVESLIASNLLARYGSFETFTAALSRIDRRLSQRVRAKESAAEYVEQVQSNYGELESEFMAFFPQLVSFFEANLPGESEKSALIL